MSKKPYKKPPLNYSEQLKQLKKRGLTVNNEPKALHLLENISYYRLSAYWYPLLESPKSAHKFKEGSTFKQSFQLYCFDRELRQLIINDLEKIEVGVRAKLTYILAYTNGPNWYQDQNLFTDLSKFEKSFDKLKAELDRSDEDFIKSFNKKYSDPLPPSWMIFEISSFGALSHYYSNLKPGKSKREIANYFGLDDRTFMSWLHTLTYVRNLCAHHSRFWNKRMRISPQIPNSPANDFITILNLPSPSDPNKKWRINDRAYFIICMIQYLLNIINPNNTFAIKIEELLAKYPMIDRKAIGYPEGWDKEPLWS